MGHTLVMGARTFESIGKPLPGRTTWVLSRSQQSIPGVTIFASVEAAIDRVLESGMPARPFICGGEEIYRQTLPLCADLYLTEVRMVPPEGDAFFPEINENFEISEIISDNCDFRIVHWRNRHYSD